MCTVIWGPFLFLDGSGSRGIAWNETSRKLRSMGVKHTKGTQLIFPYVQLASFFPVAELGVLESVDRYVP